MTFRSFLRYSADRTLFSVAGTLIRIVALVAVSVFAGVFAAAITGGDRQW